MKANSIIFGSVPAIGLYLAYSVGHKQGIEAAPVYVAHQVAKQAVTNDEVSQWMAEYESSQEKVCDQIFELVLDYEANGLDLDHRERDGEF